MWHMDISHSATLPQVPPPLLSPCHPSLVPHPLLICPTPCSRPRVHTCLCTQIAIDALVAGLIAGRSDHSGLSLAGASRCDSDVALSLCCGIWCRDSWWD